MIIIDNIITELDIASHYHSILGRDFSLTIDYQFHIHVLFLEIHRVGEPSLTSLIPTPPLSSSSPLSSPSPPPPPPPPHTHTRLDRFCRLSFVHLPSVRWNVHRHVGGEGAAPAFEALLPLQTMF